MAALDEVHGWLERELPSLLQEYGVPAASVAVMVGEQRRTVASGVLNLETGVEATTDAVFQIGSVTKVFTATLIMQLVDEGLLSLDDTVQSVLPGFRVADAEAGRVGMERVLASPMVYCTHCVLALSLARSGAGVALVPDFLAAEHLQSGALQICFPGAVASARI